MREVTSIPVEWLRVVPVEERARFTQADILDIPEVIETKGDYDEFDDPLMFEDK